MDPLAVSILSTALKGPPSKYILGKMCKEKLCGRKKAESDNKCAEDQLHILRDIIIKNIHL